MPDVTTALCERIGRRIGHAFGIRVDNIYVKKTFVLDRSDSASFLRKLLAAFDRTVEEHLK